MIIVLQVMIHYK